MVKILVSFLLVIFASGIQKVYDVIIIGAGLSGASASRILTQRGIPHLMLEARNRTGGRILSGTFQNLTVDLGASFVHSPNKTNPITQLMKQLNWSALPGRMQNEAYLYQSPDIVNHKIVSVLYRFYESMVLFIKFKSQMSPLDLSVKDAAQGYFEHIMSKEDPVYRDLLNWYLESYGNVEGANLDQISARQFQLDQTPNDMIPAGGYPTLFNALFRKCSPELKLNQEVLEIDYTHDIVKVKTHKGYYYGKKIINSIPLGVLKAGKIKFIPQLPQPYQAALLSVAQGSENKLYVRFEEPFWDTTNRYAWLNFVAKGQKRSDLSVAMIYPKQLSEGKPILVFFLAGRDNQKVDNLTEAQLKKYVESFLRPYAKKKPIVKSVLLTKWHQDPYSLGSYTYFVVGGSRANIETLRKPLRNKIWFVGEHTHPKMKSLTQAAFATGKAAAEQISDEERTRIKQDYFQ